MQSEGLYTYMQFPPLHGEKSEITGRINNIAMKKRKHFFIVSSFSPNDRFNGSLNAMDISHNESDVQLVRGWLYFSSRMRHQGIKV